MLAGRTAAKYGQIAVKSWDFSICLCLSIYRACCKVKLLERKKNISDLSLLEKNQKPFLQVLLNAPVKQTPTLVIRIGSTHEVVLAIILKCVATCSNVHL